VSVKITVFCDAALCSLVEVKWHVPLTAPPPRKMQHVPLKCQNTSTRLHDTTSQKTIFSSVNGCSHSAFANLKFYRVS